MENRFKQINQALSGLLFAVFLSACGPVTPTVEEIYPVYGLVRGGEKVLVRGEELGQLAPFNVYFGDNRVEVSGFEDGDLWVTLPEASEEGVVDVRLIGADGTEFHIPNGFEYVHMDKMAECVNISRALNGKEVVPQK